MSEALSRNGYGVARIERAASSPTVVIIAGVSPSPFFWDMAGYWKTFCRLFILKGDLLRLQVLEIDDFAFVWPADAIVVVPVCTILSLFLC